MIYPEPGCHYLHYKGGIYKVMFLSKHTETGEILVNYQSIIFGTYFSRPLDSWNEKTIDGQDRFILSIGSGNTRISIPTTTPADREKMNEGVNPKNCIY